MKTDETKPKKRGHVHVYLYIFRRCLRIDRKEAKDNMKRESAQNKTHAKRRYSGHLATQSIVADLHAGDLLRRGKTPRRQEKQKVQNVAWAIQSIGTYLTPSRPLKTRCVVWSRQRATSSPTSSGHVFAIKCFQRENIKRTHLLYSRGESV